MFERYAIYCTFDGALGKSGAAWLGYDLKTGQAIAHPQYEGVDLVKATSRPRPYGLHATIKAPFRLSEGADETALKTAFTSFCLAQKAASAEGFDISQIGRFLALTLRGDPSQVMALAAQAVRELDDFRAPLSERELERRRPAHLSETQRQYLMRWGYPHVMDAFQFHVTLTGPLNDKVRSRASIAANAHFSPKLPAPFTLGSLSLVGQNASGYFKEILSLPLQV